MDFLINKWASLPQEQQTILLFGFLFIFVGFIAREFIWKSFLWTWGKIFPPKKRSEVDNQSGDASVKSNQYGVDNNQSSIKDSPQALSLQIGTLNGSVVFPPNLPTPSIASSEDALSQPPERRVIVELQEPAKSICAEIEKYFPESSDGIREACALAQEAKATRQNRVAAAKYLQVFNSIFSLFRISSHCSTQDVVDLLSELDGGIKAIEKSLKNGNFEKKELEFCENYVLVIFGKFRV